MGRSPPTTGKTPSMKLSPFTIPCLAALGLAACAQPAAVGPAASRNPVYAFDLAGKAATCTAADVSVSEGQPATGSIETGGGGWCGIAVTRGGNALAAGLLTQAPRAGHVYVHTVGDVTRVDYTPNGAPGADAFTVKFIPGDEVMNVNVNSAGVKK